MRRLIPGWALDSYGLSMAGFIVSLMLGALCLVTIGTVDSRNACNYAQDKYKRDTVWNFWRGCYIRSTGDQYVELGQYRVVVNGGK
jgi:hypothetical protein